MEISKNFSNNRDSGNCRSEAGRRRICFFHFVKNRFATAFTSTLLLCLAPAAAATAQELGRLFFTPQQRQDLDRRRATNRAEEEAPQIKEGPLTLEGHVQRSGGKAVTWVNGVPQYDSRASRDPARVTVIPNAGEPGVSLKIGQIYERSSGEVRDSLNGGVITVGKPSVKKEPATGRRAAAKSPAPAR
jgi:hypothetical protein